ncbi:clathrin light chain [Thelephora ganbajun]|uniref:Clathrin light chain n=1 Tax=Thelephora ganbajun TaxID=370292 RepID=A0ACB6ZVY9_THEGA|nr:clathrin light chain [Thelephora ganbajun]
MTDFLSRESKLLGGSFSADDDIDFDRAISAFPDISLDGSGDIPTPTLGGAPTLSHQTSTSSYVDFDDFVTPSSHADVKVTGDDEIEQFESQFPDIDVPVSSPPVIRQQATFGGAPTFAPRPQPPASAATPIFNAQLEEDEPEVIKEWREKQEEAIKARDAASKAKRQETIAKAERAIDAFYEDYARKKERNIRENKEHEKQFLESQSLSLSSGTTWSRICDLVELQNSQSKTIARAGPNTTDISRFKEVLLRLKREGENAPGAQGY